MEDSKTNPKPKGELMIRTVALPKDTNGYGNVYAGWILSQIDQAASAAAEQITKCRVVTVAIKESSFVSPVKVGSLICLYTTVLEVGRSSITVGVDVWAHKYNETDIHKVTETELVLVSVDDNGHSKIINQH